MTLTEVRAGICSGDGPCDPSPIGEGKNWVTKTGGQDPYARAIIHALMRAGHPESEAEALAHAAIERWAHGAGNVSAATRERAAKSLAAWDAEKAASHTRAVTEWGSGGPGTTGPAATNFDTTQAGSLLPRGGTKKPDPDEAHAYRGTDLSSCTVCGKPATAAIHQHRSTGVRATGAYSSGHQFWGNQYSAAEQSNATPAQLQQLAEAIIAESNGGFHISSASSSSKGGSASKAAGAAKKATPKTAAQKAAAKAATAAKTAAAKQTAAKARTARMIASAQKGITAAKAHAEAERARAGAAKSDAARATALALAEKYQTAATALQDALDKLEHPGVRSDPKV